MQRIANDCGKISHGLRVRSIKWGGVLGFWTPHHLHTFETHMSIVGNAFKVPNRPSTISWYDRHHHDLSHIDGTAPYPPCKDILTRVSAQQGDGNSLEGCHDSDALFGFVIQFHLDSIARRGQIENDPILMRILSISLYDWKAPDCQGGGNQPSVPICCMAILGSQLLKLVDVLSDQVSFESTSSLAEVDHENF